MEWKDILKRYANPFGDEPEDHHANRENIKFRDKIEAMMDKQRGKPYDEEAYNKILQEFEKFEQGYIEVQPSTNYLKGKVKNTISHEKRGKL
tara:strand:- start:197 stop:472 length:276 start_codon:yes stop_codon:yes gene_type:complete